MQGVLSVALSQALDHGLIPSNPAARVKKAAKRGRSPMRAPSHEEASSLISAAGGTRDEALIVCWPSGPVMRQGELAALRWEDVELSDKPTITVKRSADTRTQTRISTTKTGEERRVGFGARTVTVLKAHRSASSRGGWLRRPGRTPASSSRTRRARCAAGIP
jgi:integrase